MKHVLFWLLFGWLLFPSSAKAWQDQERMTASAAFAVQEAKAGETVTLKVTLSPIPPFHTYPTKQSEKESESFVTRLRLKGEGAEIKGPIKEPKGKTHVVDTLVYDVYEEPALLEVPVLIKSGTKAGDLKIDLRIDTQACDEKGCLPFNAVIPLTIKVLQGEPKTETKSTTPPEKSPTKVEPKATDTAPKSDKPAEAKPSDSSSDDRTFLISAAVAGFITIFTPCVFPMIPITVSSFLKSKNTSWTQSLANASVYAVTIIIALTVIAMTMLVTFQELSRRPATNFILGGIFLFFALSLLGMYEITLPTWMTNWSSKGQDQTGYLGIIFTALTFTIISFSCVAPFLGGFAGAAAKERSSFINLMGAFVFSATFAAPFFLLALFPAVLRNLPKSGGWLNAVKVVMGFIEIAAALKFFRQAELFLTKSNPDYFTYDIVLSLYVVLCFLCGIYLLGLFRMPHDHHDGEHPPIGVLRAIWAIVFIGLGLYLAPGLWRDADSVRIRPTGKIFDWIDSFLLPGEDTAPKETKKSDGKSARRELHWTGDLKAALQKAREDKKRIFIDFTGET